MRKKVYLSIHAAEDESRSERGNGERHEIVEEIGQCESNEEDEPQIDEEIQSVMRRKR